jgi:ATP-binding cassette subfamily C protein
VSSTAGIYEADPHHPNLRKSAKSADRKIIAVVIAIDILRSFPLFEMVSLSNFPTNDPVEDPPRPPPMSKTPVLSNIPPSANSLETAKALMIRLLRFARWKAFLSFCLTVVLGLTQGVGILLLLPFLQIIGIGAQESANPVAEVMKRVLEFLHVPLTLPAILVLYIGIVSIHAIGHYCKSSLNARITNGFSHHLRQNLYKTLNRMDWTTFLSMRPSNITQVFTSDIAQVGFAGQQMLLLSTSLFLMMVHVAVALVLSTRLTIIVLIFGGVLSLALRFLNQYAHSIGERWRTATRKMYAIISDHLAGMKITKIYQLGNAHTETFIDASEESSRQMTRFIELTSATHACFQISSVCALAAFFFIGYEVIDVPLTNLLLIVFLLARLLPEFSSIQQSTQRVINAFPSFHAVLRAERDFTQNASPVIGTQTADAFFRCRKSIEFKNVSFAYPGCSLQDEAVFRNANFSIETGAFVAIIGPSGSGKTTIADLLMGLLRPSAGRIEIDGRPLEPEMLHAWLTRVGYVPQDAFLFQESVRDNLLRSAPAADEEDLWKVLDLVMAGEFVRKLPQGIDTMIGDRGTRLSGGERQRIALARALVRNPDMLLLDEATNALDRENERKIEETIESFHGKITLITITHRLNSIRKPDQVLKLENGSIQMIEAAQ